MKTFKTAKGTELPITDLNGRDYLEVKYRILWFREEHPDWSIETDAIQITEESSTMKASIKDETGRVRSTGHSTETINDFRDFVEKSETAAIGRALATIGYGTQFAAELEESESPPVAEEYIIRVGKRHRGKRLSEVSREEIRDYMDWLERNAQETGKSLSPGAQEFIQIAESYLSSVH
jgi:hypothetical protein